MSHGMLQPVPAQGGGSGAKVFLCISGTCVPHSHVHRGTRTVLPCPGSPCAGDSRVRMGCAIGGSDSLDEGEDQLLLAVGLFGAGPLVLSCFAVVEAWCFLGCRAGFCS